MSNMYGKALLISCLICLVASICVAGDIEQIVTAQCDFQRANYCSTTTQHVPSEIAWQIDTAGIRGGSPAMSYRNNVYYVDGSGLHAYEEQSGKQLWTWEGKSQLNEYVYAKPDLLINKGVIYLALFSLQPPNTSHQASSVVVAIDHLSGNTLWSYKSELEGDVQPPIIHADNLIIAVGQYVISLNLRTRKEDWRFKADAPIGKLSLYQETVLFGTNTFKYGVYAISAITGEKKWNGSRNGSFTKYIPIADGIGFIGTMNGVNAFDITTGELKWSQPAVGHSIYQFAVDEEAVYGNSINGLFALDNRDGRIKWINKQNSAQQPPTIVGKHLYVSAPNKLIVIDKETGKSIQQITGLGHYAFFTTPAISSGAVFVGGGEKDNYKLFCIR